MSRSPITRKTSDIFATGFWVTVQKKWKQKAMKLTDKEFDRIVKRAIRRIPLEIRKHLDNVQITVQSRPSTKMLEEIGLPGDKTLLGLFRGVPLKEQSVTSPPLFPGTIFIFQEPLEGVCKTMEELERQIAITVVHEIAHAIGINEERLGELGYG